MTEDQYNGPAGNLNCCSSKAPCLQKCDVETSPLHLQLSGEAFVQGKKWTDITQWVFAHFDFVLPSFF